MCKSNIGRPGRNSAKKSEKLQQVTLNSVRNVLTDELITQSCQDVNYRFRDRLLNPTVTVLHMVMAALWPEDSFNACWHVLWDNFVSCFPEHKGKSPSRGRVAEARGRIKGVRYNIGEAGFGFEV